MTDLSFEAKFDNPTSSPVAGRRGLSSSELRTEDEFDLDFAFEFDLDRSLDRRRSIIIRPENVTVESFPTRRNHKYRQDPATLHRTRRTELRWPENFFVKRCRPGEVARQLPTKHTPRWTTEDVRKVIGVKVIISHHHAVDFDVVVHRKNIGVFHGFSTTWGMFSSWHSHAHTP